MTAKRRTAGVPFKTQPRPWLDAPDFRQIRGANAVRARSRTPGALVSRQLTRRRAGHERRLRHLPLLIEFARASARRFAKTRRRATRRAQCAAPTNSFERRRRMRCEVHVRVPATVHADCVRSGENTRGLRACSSYVRAAAEGHGGSFERHLLAFVADNTRR